MAAPRDLIVNGRFLAGPEGAVNGVALALSRALHAAWAGGASGWRVTLAVPPCLEPAARRTGLPVRVIGRRTGIAWEQGCLPPLRREGIVAGFFNTVPLIGTGYVTLLHDAQVFTVPRAYRARTRAWRRLLSRRAGAEGNRVLTVSNHSRRRLLACGIGRPHRIGVVPNGPGPAALARPDKGILARLGLRGVPFVLGPATGAPHKNAGLLIAAAGAASVRLVLTGAEGRAALQGSSLAPGGGVVFPGRVTDAEMAALIDAALAVCVPSREEGFGLPLLEAMTRGTPAIVAPCGALPEVAGGAAALADPDDPAAWAALIARLRDDPVLACDLSARGRARATDFSWSASAAATLGWLDGWFPS